VLIENGTPMKNKYLLTSERGRNAQVLFLLLIGQQTKSSITKYLEYNCKKHPWVVSYVNRLVNNGYIHEKIIELKTKTNNKIFKKYFNLNTKILLDECEIRDIFFKAKEIEKIEKIVNDLTTNERLKIAFQQFQCINDCPAAISHMIVDYYFAHLLEARKDSIILDKILRYAWMSRDIDLPEIPLIHKIELLFEKGEVKLSDKEERDNEKFFNSNVQNVPKAKRELDKEWYFKIRDEYGAVNLF
jgi:hypothetical protein